MNSINYSISFSGILFLLLFSNPFNHVTYLHGQTIAEKKAGLNRGSIDLSSDMQALLSHVNKERRLKQDEIYHLYEQVSQLYEKNASDVSYCALLEKINIIKKDLCYLDEQWRESVSSGSREEGYALWQQPDTTIEQLVMDYGSQDYVYLIPDEIGGMKLSVTSNLPIPRTAWSEMLEAILTQNGIGIRQINPYLRELYFLEPNCIAIKNLTNCRKDLALFPSETRVAFILTPEPSEVRRMWFFLDKFINHKSTILQLIGRDILIIATAGEIQDLLKLSDFVAANKGEKEYKLVPLMRVEAEQMSRILAAIFEQNHESPVSTFTHSHNTGNNQSLGNTMQEIPSAALEGNGLKVVMLENVSQALFLVGTKDEVKRAEDVIHEVESQLGGVRDKIIYWYTVKHSEAEELAAILDKVYNLMLQENVGRENGSSNGNGNGNNASNGVNVQVGGVPTPDPSVQVIAPEFPFSPPPPPERYFKEGFYQDGQVAINPTPILSQDYLREPIVNINRNNFIVDLKTSSIVMVVEAEYLPKLKDLIRKLDVPKKMVRIEVMLVEKRIHNTSNYGINLLKVGDAACDINSSSAIFDGRRGSPCEGILSLMFSHAKSGGIPAFDLTYNFLLSQDDISINSSPSITTINQTPATIIIQEERSIKTGIYDIRTVDGISQKDSFTRAQYGINLAITPTIHTPVEIDGLDCKTDVDYITLETKVDFDTIHPGTDPQQPNVTRRQIENEVVIPDGQTVILGGLRAKNTRDLKESIPFIGEIPGIGKLFSNTVMQDESVEMFIFITPKIIYDPCEDQNRIRMLEMQRRPGDVPAFMCALEDSRNWEKNLAFKGTMRVLFGRPPERCFDLEEAYDGW